MRTIKLLSVIVIAMLASIAHAQDIIVKKDGSTITSKVTEITSTEIKYKKFSNPNGPTYTLGKNEINYINYENGERETITSSSNLNSTSKSSITTTQDKFQASDEELLNNLYIRPALKKAKKLKLIGFIGGGVLLAASIPFLLASDDGAMGMNSDERTIHGCAFAGAGLLWGGSFLLASKIQKNKAKSYADTSIPVMQFEITNSKHTALYANIDMLDEGIKSNKALGIGLHLNF